MYRDSNNLKSDTRSKNGSESTTAKVHGSSSEQRMQASAVPYHENRSVSRKRSDASKFGQNERPSKNRKEREPTAPRPYLRMYENPFAERCKTPPIVEPTPALTRMPVTAQPRSEHVSSNAPTVTPTITAEEAKIRKWRKWVEEG